MEAGLVLATNTALAQIGIVRFHELPRIHLFFRNQSRRSKAMLESGPMFTPPDLLNPRRSDMSL